MKTQEISAEKLLDLLEEKERKITELEQENQWLMDETYMGRVLRNMQAFTVFSTFIWNVLSCVGYVY